MKTNVASRGVVRVMADRCATCIFRPGNLMRLHAGRVRGMVAAVKRDDGCIPCHKTIDLEEQAVCRGQFDTVKTTPLQIAERLGRIEYIHIDCKENRDPP
jgi:hypothetical protein